MLAEVREADAPPEVAAIYAQLREACGLPLVNLIWRHFATLDGVLPWAWNSVRPTLPLLAGARERVRAALAVPSLPVGEEAARLAALYNRGNLGNLILLTALLRGKQGHSTAPEAPPPEMLPASVPLPKLEELPAATARAVRALGALHGHEAGVIPTLYLHLAHWPALPTPLCAALSPMIATGRIAALREAVLAAASVEADGLRPCLAAPPEPPAEALSAARGTLRLFVTRVIPEMVPIGLMLRP
ncbi:hypothetical protein EJV46_02400 [Roseococcus sp. SYP-B2431]|uniref:hypothetical protein n=1 Tax=Roseococcus sp. SYP-B2431 TaxID=2496640 RepID=UPI00103BB2D5|nr:hypothetical protein [Roseococcus sp. SYP-B2431]TCH99546.1 hypothetical protein EJV46_02400 [Roseococcus sp. SYP-B2431]